VEKGIFIKGKKREANTDRMRYTLFNPKKVSRRKKIQYIIYKVPRLKADWIR
jgi:hypothetical protein